MVGSSPTQAFPRIIIACQSRYFCEKSCKLIKKTDWWRDFKKAHPWFGFLCMQLGPQTNAPSTGYKPFVHQIGNASAASGQHITFTRDREASESVESHPSPHAVLGGFLTIDGEIFGITVAHPLSKAIHEAAAQSDSSYESWSEFEDDGEDDGCDGGLSSSASDYLCSNDEFMGSSSSTHSY